MQLFKCSFPETGEFSYSPELESGGCEDPFMSMHRRGPSPCGARCCRPDHVGDFSPVGTAPGINATRYAFQPTDNDCRYEQISRGQVLHYLNARGAPLVVFGDSMMRQFFLRLVMMMRGQQRLLDYHLHAHAQYEVCHEADVFRLSTASSNLTAGTPNNEHLKAKIPTFFSMSYGPGKVSGRAALQRCSRRPAQFHYLHSPKWKNQASMIPVYMNSLPAGVKPVILTSVGYWESNDTVPEGYLEAVAALKATALKVFIISPPTVRVPDEHRREVLKIRNEFMKQWVTDQGEPFVFLDFDTMASAPTIPPGGSLGNWHYMCSIAWRISCNGCDLVQVDHSDGVDPGSGEGGYVAAQITQGQVERIHATDDGMCADEMNRNLWQVVFNTLLKPRGGGEEGGGGGGDNSRRRDRRRLLFWSSGDGGGGSDRGTNNQCWLF